NTTDQQWLNQHPLIQIASAKWRINQAKAKQALLATKADAEREKLAIKLRKMRKLDF
ncbi:MAG: hypothetical protein JKY55_14790, partial [Aliivibrio sp.]|nr:hypothetical protein [Aliivibrio sp.]